MKSKIQKSKEVIHQTVTVDIGLLRPNSWNYNRQTDAVYRAVVESIRRDGFVLPVVVRQNDNYYEIIDGEHRWKAAKELAYKEIPVIVLKADDVHAKALTIRFNETKGEPDDGALAKLLLEIQSIPDVRIVLPWTDDELKALLEGASADLDDMLKDEESKSGKIGRNDEDDDSISVIVYLPPDEHASLTELQDRLVKLLPGVVDKKGFQTALTALISVACGLTNEKLMKAYKRGQKADIELSVV